MSFYEGVQYRTAHVRVPTASKVVHRAIVETTGEIFEHTDIAVLLRRVAEHAFDPLRPSKWRLEIGGQTLPAPRIIGGITVIDRPQGSVGSEGPVSTTFPGFGYWLDGVFCRPRITPNQPFIGQWTTRKVK